MAAVAASAAVASAAAVATCVVCSDDRSSPMWPACSSSCASIRSSEIGRSVSSAAAAVVATGWATLLALLGRAVLSCSFAGSQLRLARPWSAGPSSERAARRPRAPSAASSGSPSEMKPSDANPSLHEAEMG
eukprot:519158-Prymnesium_polylepis.1